MNSKEYLEEQKINDKKKVQLKALKKIPNGGIVKSLFSNDTIELSKESVTLGLLLLNGIEELKDSDAHHYYGDRINTTSKRFPRCKEILLQDNIWDGEYYNLLIYFFGKDKAPYIQSTWNSIPFQMYQTGYNRRSFRAPKMVIQHLVNQINTIADLNRRISYKLNLQEYIIHDNDIGGYSEKQEYLWATAIEHDNEEIYTLLLDIIYGRHEAGKVTSPIIQALLLSKQEEAWEAIGKLLLSAQRQEGLRQTILECLDETSLGAMKYMLKIILDNKLTRFSSVVRALDVWTGFGWESEKEKTVRRFFEFGLYYLENPSEIKKAIHKKDNSEVYMALWALGAEDVEKCFPLIKKLYKTGSIEKKCLALFITKNIALDSYNLDILSEALQENNQQIEAFALPLFNSLNDNYILSLKRSHREKLFYLLESKLETTPTKVVNFQGKVFSWLSASIQKDDLFSAMIKLSDETNDDELHRLLPYLPSMSLSNRENLTRIILKEHWGYYASKNSDNKIKLTSLQRTFAFLVITDRAEMIKDAAIRALHHAEINDDELPIFEKMLKRKSGDLRKSIIILLLTKKDSQIRMTVKSLLSSRNQEQRLAALDMLHQIHLKKKQQEWVIEEATNYAERSTITDKENILLSQIINKDHNTDEYSKENGFGLFNPQNTSPIIEPSIPTNGIYIDKTKENPFALSMPADEVQQKIASLKKLFTKYKKYEYECENWDNSKEVVLLGNKFNSFTKNMNKMSNEEKYYNYPLPEVWKQWYEDSHLTPCDLFLIYINAGNKFVDEDEKKSLFPKATNLLKKMCFIPKILKKNKYTWDNPIYTIISNLTLIYPFNNQVEFLNGFLNTFLSQMDSKERSTHKIVESYYGSSSYNTWRNIDIIDSYLGHYKELSNEMDDKNFTQYWQLISWEVNTAPDTKRDSIKLSDIFRAYTLQLMTKDELIDNILTSSALSTLTDQPQKDKIDFIEKHPFLQEIINACKERILEIELKRGDSTTEVTALASSLQNVFGIDTYVKILKALGDDALYRGYTYWVSDESTKREILSQLLKRCYPLPSDDQESFNEVVRKARLTEEQLITSAMYAQQWIPFVSQYVKWDGMESAIWWLHAHTNAYHSAETETEISKYSPVNMEDFKNGAVDIDWFQESYKMLKKKKWEQLYQSAKYISDGNGHKRAQLYADVILGNIKIKEVQKKVKDKRSQDYLRVFGLIPLSKKRREKDLLERYKYLQQFKKESKQFGAQRQTSEALAVRIAMENLARTAGYADPIRLTWAMETEVANQIIADNPPLLFDTVKISLLVDELGKAHIQTEKDGKIQKSIPAKLRKDKAVIAMKDACKVIKDQYNRTRKSLEDAMVNGDIFEINEIESLMTHPVVAPMLSKLVLKSGTTLGFYSEGKLIDYKGKSNSITENLVIAHCSDIFENGHWSDYQHYCFTEELIQPFKQVFRELYTPTDDEKKEVARSRRYAGHQVQPAKTVALLKSRGWSVDYDEGLQKVFHKEGFVAKMYAMADWFSPADVESPTLETIEFKDKKTWKNIPFDKIDGRIFSEVMRDIDLVVSVAHVGEVDPEASHSSIEMRTAIIKETVQLFKLKNVTLKGSHAHISGDLGEYSVHLGSAVTFKEPGIALSILPVHSQHRGRLFLPFVDEDPKSAEVMSKILLLAKDKEIKDPTILRQFN